MTSTNQKQNNDKLIQKGFTSLLVTKDAHIERVMLEVLDEALDELKACHYDMPFDLHHTSETDTLGWALIHNGKVIKAVAHDGGIVTAASAIRTLHKIVSEGSHIGWYGILCSDVTNNWYRIDWEMDWMNYTASYTAHNIQQYLKKI